MRKHIAGAAAAAIATVTITGCSASGQGLVAQQIDCTLPDGAVAIAAAGRANAPQVGGTPSVAAAIDHAISTQARLGIFDTSGSPQLVVEDSLELNAQNGPAREDEVRLKRTQIEDALLAVRAETPEANPLDALGLAADYVRGHGSTGTVVLFDSGLQTTGALNYTVDGMLKAEPGDLAGQVAAAGLLPDLSGMTVALSGIGSTAAPQRQLDNADRERLQQQWVALAQAAGAACIYLDEVPSTGAAPTGVPAVSLVTPSLPKQFDLKFDAPIPLREDTLRFQDDSPALVDPVDAQARLRPLVEALQNTPGTIRLTGTTASGGTEEGRLALSRQRAQTAKDLLVSMGVPEERITVEGVGTNFPGFQQDTDAQGKQIPDVAARNRSVILEVQQSNR